MIDSRIDTILVVVHVERHLAGLPGHVTCLVAAHLLELVPEAGRVLRRRVGAAVDNTSRSRYAGLISRGLIRSLILHMHIHNMYTHN